MRYPQKVSLTGLLLGVFGLLQVAMGGIFVLLHFSRFDFTELIYENEILMYLMILLRNQMIYYMDAEWFLLLAVSMVINGCMYIAFYLILNKVNQTNAMVRRIFDKVNK